MSSERSMMRWWLASFLLLGFISAALLLWPSQPVVPNIQGAVLPQPKLLKNIALINHHGEGLKESDFTGRWHLVSYGFTHCPDICPTLLSDLKRFQTLLESEPAYRDIQVWFYTVDPQRDSVAALKNYVPWFDPRFIGVRARDPDAAKGFEESLGINASVSGVPGDEDYQVNHGFLLFLIDEQAQLRAALSPTRTRQGQQFFEPEQVLKDYLALRAWVGE
ncbi:protein SCO1/2 [Litorivivens lipolytica]|uniref:Protein SCO1/2 n=1 Tax=Litorivivens lipolytica TaxID=1524264 RepID=A0A7W4W7V5_9GAMM|nr:SCO family protein [Litorivivens lipolytica]MBB3048643.1 protein SCO1/2 [Litorivivens lipolytica]